MKDAQGRVTHYIGVFTDISKRKRAEEIIRHMAYHDVLTDLPNRILFIEHLNQALAQARRNHTVLAVLFLDLDKIKTINDTLGHDVGDRLLQQVAARIKSSLRAVDTVARLGGDEFMILLPLAKNPLDASKTAQKVLDALRPAFTIESHEVYITASVGISLYPFDGNDSLSLMRNADAAMYQAKRQGRNTYRVFMPTMQATLLQQITLGNDFRHALEHQEFVVHYQPQINVKSGAITGAEALARWKHPKLGLLPPSEFIPWAEDAGWIVPLGTYILRTACAQSRTWESHGLPQLKVSVNVSARQFKRGHLVEAVSQVLRETNLPSSRLRLEVTESGMMGTSESEVAIPRDLQSMGVGLSIDDFGMGYASLNYLRRFPLTSLKIDQSFIRDLASDANAATIVKAVIALGHALELTVVAEGVETEDQLNILRQLGCDEIQGFLVSKPLPPESLEQFLRENHPLTGAALN